MCKGNDKNNEYLKVFLDRSIYVSDDVEVEYKEGPQSENARKNQAKIKSELDNGFLDNVIAESFLTDEEKLLLDNTIVESMHKLIESITSEVGRAIVGLTVLQLTIKSIVPKQSIRLHKASQNRGSFSWIDGVPMRVLDKEYITPKLREYNLLKLNADGFMMTRSLAENYPYTKLYKANIRGAKDEWILIVNYIELNPNVAFPCLKLFITLLKQRSINFNNKVELTKAKVSNYISSVSNIENMKELLFSFPSISSYSARLFEILIHSFYCTLADEELLGNFLKPLSQMRSANKKHGNIGDVELIERPNSMSIIEAWDAKYGKSYLRDELEELKDKLEFHDETRLAGFITNGEPTINPEIITRKEEIEELFDVEIRINSIGTWYSDSLSYYNINDEFSFIKKWFKTFFNYLFLERYDVAPIDEPTDIWIDECAAQI